MERPIVNVVATGTTRDYDAQYKIKVLKPNIPFADQVTDENTKYVIRWNFDLEGDEVEIPANCILGFQGGSISNGNINSSDLKVEGGKYNVFTNIVFTGITPIVYAEWIGVDSKNDGATNAANFNSFIESVQNEDANAYIKVIFDNKTYNFTRPIEVKTGTHLSGNTVFAHLMSGGATISNKTELHFINCDGIISREDYAGRLYIDGIVVTYEGEDSHTGIDLTRSNRGTDLIIENVNINGFLSGYGLKIKNTWRTNISNVYITRCGCGVYVDPVNGQSVNAAVNATVFNNLVIEQSSNGIVFAGSTNSAVHLSNCTIEGIQLGIADTSTPSDMRILEGYLDALGIEDVSECTIACFFVGTRCLLTNIYWEANTNNLLLGENGECTCIGGLMNFIKSEKCFIASQGKRLIVEGAYIRGNANIEHVFIINSNYNHIIKGNTYRNITDEQMYYDPLHESNFRNYIAILENIDGTFLSVSAEDKDINVVAGNKLVFEKTKHGTAAAGAYMVYSDLYGIQLIVNGNTVPCAVNARGMYFPPLSEAPQDAPGGIYKADGVNWDPLKRHDGTPYYVQKTSNSGTFKPITGLQDNHYGATANRPKGVAGGGRLNPEDVGYRYYDTQLKKPIWAASINSSDGTVRWIESDGALAGINRSGTWAQRPLVYADVYPGFRYMIVDGTVHIPVYVGGFSNTNIKWYKADGTKYTGE